MDDLIGKWYADEEKKISQEEEYLDGYKFELSTFLNWSDDMSSTIFDLLNKRKNMLEEKTREKLLDYYVLGRLAAIRKAMDRVQHIMLIQSKAV